MKLDQFLKWKNLVSSGGEAKIFIKSGSVKVNGVIETRRGRKLNKGDIVMFLKNEYPRTYQRVEKDHPGMKVIEIKNILNNLDKDGVPFAKGGIIKDPTFTNYNE